MTHFSKLFLNSMLSMAMLSLLWTSGAAQQKRTYNIAIFLYQDVELLDFAGPGEAFSATPDFNVYTLSVDGKQLLSQGFVSINPQYSIDNAPVPDIIVFPGGGVDKTCNNQKVLDWINSLVSKGTTAMSVCNGASILAKTGLLDGLTVTTHHSNFANLRSMLPHSTVLEDKKYVDNGNIITTAGVSAGIEGALHVISRIKGMDVAKSVAFYMEYNKWKPEEGMVVYKNDYIEKWVAQSKEIQTGTNTAFGNTGIHSEIPYEGELKNLGMELFDKGNYQEAAEVLEQAVKWYPYSASSFSILAKVYAKLGRPVPPDQDRFLKIIDSGKTDEAILLYENTRRDYPGWQLFEESPINMAGYHRLLNKDYTNAVKILSLNTKAFPDSWNAWDSLAEANMKAGNKKEAISDYRKSLALNPKNENARNLIAQLGVN